MSVAEDQSSKSKTVSASVPEEFADEFERAFRQAQVDGHIDLNASRSEAIRRLMRAAIEDPSLFGEK